MTDVTNSKLWKYAESWCGCCSNKDNCLHCNWQAIKDLIGKQTPKKPNKRYVDSLSLDMYECPTCGELFTFDYCEHCGQLIDWRRD